MKILLLADIHIGSIKDCAYMYSVLTEIIDKEIGFDKCDAVILLGDYFDRLFKLNEEFVGLAVNTMSYLIRKCKATKTKIRIIYGTESHEMGQYRIFNYHLTSSGVDMKLIDTCTEEELLPGVNVLYVPEEYMDSKTEFYKNTIFSGKKYDYIFGHGMIMDGMPEEIALTKIIETEKQVPRFVSTDFTATEALVVFGHYHQHVDINDKIHYVGSLFRSKFGEDTPKGYAVIRDGAWEFIENTKAYQFRHYTYKPDSEVFKSPENLLNEINRIKRLNEDILSDDVVGKIKLNFNVPEDVFTSFRETLRSALVNEKRIIIAIREKNVEEKIESENEESTYDYLLDGSLDLPTKIHMFMQQFFGPDNIVDANSIKRYITEDLSL